MKGAVSARRLVLIHKDTQIDTDTRSHDDTRGHRHSTDTSKTQTQTQTLTLTQTQAHTHTHTHAHIPYTYTHHACGNDEGAAASGGQYHQQVYPERQPEKSNNKAHLPLHPTMRLLTQSSRLVSFLAHTRFVSTGKPPKTGQMEHRSATATNR